MSDGSLDLLLRELMAEQGMKAEIPQLLSDKRKLLRALVNVRPPGALKPHWLLWQDEELGRQLAEKGVVEADELPRSPIYPDMALWQGDITRLAADAIVNAANSRMLGCFSPLHACIDNAIHSAAGMRLREECATLMKAQGGPEPTGQAKITRAYNLPAKWIIHTVGPIVADGKPGRKEMLELESCYKSCLALASEKRLASVAFCCVSTGVFGFPRKEAANIAVSSVAAFLARHGLPSLVIFNVFTDDDLKIYKKLLGYE